MRRRNILPAPTKLIIAVLLAASAVAHAAEIALPPKLILQITVDQLRGDLPGRYASEMGEGGFRYLMEKGVWYANAHHAHAITETVVGHTTLATGADPAEHGMVGNVWFNRQTGKLDYNVEDGRYRMLSSGAGVDKASEIDPTQKAAASDGRSPAAVMVSTFSDELASYSGGRSKIFAVSVKDRGAVPLAGHAGKAFWFSKKSGEFVTSTYYYDRYPAWVEEWNQQKLAQSYAGKSWELLHERASYRFGDADDKPWEAALPGYGRVFPHPFGAADGKMFGTLLTISPVGDELTLDFAQALIEHEQLGRHDVTDYLSISFSSTDYVGHFFGPSSLEAEDNLLRLDRTLARLFALVDARVGLANTLIVLSADHGTPEVPGYLNQLGIPARYVKPKDWDKRSLLEMLKQRFGVGEEIIASYHHPYIYLNGDLIRDKNLNRAALEEAIAAEWMKLDGVALAVSSTALLEGRAPDTLVTRLILHNYNRKRSGDIFVVLEPQLFINDFDGTSVAATHGSPWRYDTYVPIVFAGGKLAGERVYRAVETVDVAATLAAVAGAKPPSGARGAPLLEVLRGQGN
jgi:predicted AlkP superfamily pyrophosphatase or phosphodiesterase